MPDPVKENPQLQAEQALTIEQRITRAAVEKPITNAETKALALGAESPVTGANALYGFLAGHALETGTTNAAFGNSALAADKAGGQNTAVGQAALAQATGEANTAVGYNALQGLTAEAATNNTGVGHSAGGNATGKANVFLGREAGLNEAGDNKLHVANNGTVSLIKGVMSATEASQEIGFLGATPVKRAANPTTLAEVITILKNLGFCA